MCSGGKVSIRFGECTFSSWHVHLGLGSFQIVSSARHSPLHVWIIEGEITLAMSLLLSLGAIPDKVTSATFSTRVRIIPLWGVLDDVTPWCTFQECHICCLSKMQVPDSVSLMCSPLVGKMIENLPGHQLCTKSRLMKPTNSLVGKDVTAFGDNS